MADATRTTNLPELDSYCIRTEGHCLMPVVVSGERVVCSSLETYEPGDFVAIFQEPSVVRPGNHQVLIKQLISAPPHGFWETPRTWLEWARLPLVMARSFNPATRHLWRPQDLLGIHKVIGIVDPEWDVQRAVPPTAITPIDTILSERAAA